MVKVKIASTAGFCFGVRRAVELAEKIAVSHKKVYTLGPLIHNPQEVKRLQRNGVKAVTNGDKLNGCHLIVRTHGIPSSQKARLEAMNLNLVDATCPFVKRAQKIVKQLSLDGYQIIIVGEHTHPEVVALVSYCDGNCHVVANAGELRGIKLAEKVGIVSQTTQTLANLESVIKRIKKLRKNVKVYNTICRATVDRQQDALKLAKQVDVMVVVGGKNSGNTKRLYEISRKYTKSHLIETAGEIKASWLKGAKSVGITAGASTPQWSIREAVEKIKEISADKCQTSNSK